MRSPAVTQLFGEQIPPVELPPDLLALLREFESRWRARDARGLAALFTVDGVFKAGRDWLPGPGAIHLALLGQGRTVRLHAQAFGVDASIGYIVGSYRGDKEDPPGDAGRFMMTIRRAGGGPWRIAAAMLNDLPLEIRVPPVTVDDLITQLDAAGIRQAVVLSWAYQFGAVGRQVSGEAARVRAENDWTAQQVARFPDRLVGFCSFNPLKDYALEELDRCMRRDSGLSGLKLHFTTSAIDLRDTEHVARLRAVFRAASVRRFPIAVHMRTLDPAYGRRDAEIFLSQILPEAVETPVQIAHLAGWGGYGPETAAALEVFTDAAASGDPRVANLFFDLSGVVSQGMSNETRTQIAGRIRQLGVKRVLFAIDGPVSRQPWEQLQTLPLDEEELGTIARNLAPFLHSLR